MLRILHSADWHLGQTFRGYSREFEHEAVFGSLLTISHLFELIVILLGENGGILHPDWETVVLFGFHCIEPGGTSIVWYPLGYLASWFLVRRRLC